MNILMTLASEYKKGDRIIVKYEENAYYVATVTQMRGGNKICFVYDDGSKGSALTNSGKVVGYATTNRKRMKPISKSELPRWLKKKPNTSDNLSKVIGIIVKYENRLYAVTNVKKSISPMYKWEISLSPVRNKDVTPSRKNILTSTSPAEWIKQHRTGKKMFRTGIDQIYKQNRQLRGSVQDMLL